jgi:prepilin-type N-terminal cleavage/methylation domain-containing protein
MIKYKKHDHASGWSQGFTIIEMMIALGILAVILVTASAMMVRIGTLYTKGVNISTLQDANRTIIADLGDTIQFSGERVARGGPTSGGVSSFCIGTTRYTYVLTRMVGPPSADANTAVPHALWRDTMSASNGTCPPLDILNTGVIPADTLTVANSGYDMVPERMRLGRFNVQVPQANTFTVEVTMAYGESDLLNGLPDANGLYQCRTALGSQYCATSNIASTVVRRINLR